MADKNINRIMSNLAPKTLREKWDAYFNKGMGSGEDIDYWNNEIAEIEKGLPFENEEEHKKWLDLGSTYMGGDEYPNLTNELIKRYESKHPLIHGGEMSDDWYASEWEKYKADPNTYESKTNPDVYSAMRRYGKVVEPNHPIHKRDLLPF